MSIRLKLALVFAGLVAAGFLPTVWATYVAVRASATEQIENDLKATLHQLQARVEALHETLSEVSKGALLQPTYLNAISPTNANDEDFGLAAQGTDLSMLQEASEVFDSADLPMLKSAPLLVVVNRAGRVVFNKAAIEDRVEPAFGATLRGIGPLDQALRGLGASDLLSTHFLQGFQPPLLSKAAPPDVYVVMALPLLRGDDLVGALLIGRGAQQTLLPGLEMLSNSKVAIRAMDGEVTSTFPEGAERAMRVVMPGDPPVLERVAGTQYLMQASPLSLAEGKVAGTAFLMRDFDKSLQRFLDAFWVRLLPLAVGVLLLAAVVTRVLSQRMAQPLVTLEAAARQVQRGDLSVQVAAFGTDEVGRLAATFNEMVRGLRQRDEIKGLFKRYLNPQVVDELIRHPEKASPGGERRTLTVCFSDLVGFSSVSERMSPEELVAVLNRYFREATHALAERGATLDKFIGDAIMCFWNAPLLQEDHAARACLTALDLLAVVDRLAPEFAPRGFTRFDCRIGLNTGPCIVGNVGSEDAQFYTVMGDAVNLASRLEGAAKVYGTRTLISEDTLRAAGAVVTARELDRLRVKGRENPVRVYELLGRAGEAVPAHVAGFNEAMALYRERRFADAARAFGAAPQDPPSRLFLERCTRFIETPPSEDWDGVHTLDSK